MEDSPATILILEPDDDLRNTVALALKGQDYRVILASDWKDALSIFQQQQPDLMVLAAVLPQFPGIDLLRYLKTQGSLDFTAVIVISPIEYPELIKKAKTAGAKDLLVKPFEIEVLLRKVRKYLAEIRAS